MRLELEPGFLLWLSPIQPPRLDVIFLRVIELQRSGVFESTGALVDSLRSVIARELERMGVGEYRMDIREDPDWGHVFIVTVRASASEALRANLELQRRLPGVPIVVKWTGATDVTDEELVERVLEIAEAGGFRARAPPGFDAVQAVREVRENR